MTDIPYLGYVEVKIQILEISSFEQDVLMIVSHTTTCYHQWIPFQVGSRIIDKVVKNIMNEELRSLSQSWKLAYAGTALYKSSKVGELDKKIDISQVKGNVLKTKKVTIPAFQIIVVKGLMKVTRHCKHVHMLVELSPKCQNIFILGNTTELKGGSQVDLVLQNLSGRKVTFKPNTEVGMISAANKIPPMLTTKVIKGDVQDDKDDEKVQSKSAQVDMSESIPKQIEVDPEEIFQKLIYWGQQTGAQLYFSME